MVVVLALAGSSADRRRLPSRVAKTKHFQKAASPRVGLHRFDVSLLSFQGMISFLINSLVFIIRLLSPLMV
jgi:hypothetical protein